jgi:hypothetical protein
MDHRFGKIDFKVSLAELKINGSNIKLYILGCSNFFVHLQIEPDSKFFLVFGKLEGILIST